MGICLYICNGHSFFSCYRLYRMPGSDRVFLVGFDDGALVAFDKNRSHFQAHKPAKVPLPLLLHVPTPYLFPYMYLHPTSFLTCTYNLPVPATFLLNGLAVY